MVVRPLKASWLRLFASRDGFQGEEVYPRRNWAQFWQEGAEHDQLLDVVAKVTAAAADLTFLWGSGEGACYEMTE